ncbi:hypothetical protein G9F71_026135 [Clostridium sp. FP2]|uniref:hypothetical protein n=1 Tax=Clostridium sp. FP2 TaxID=2724481 RepID=UPI0013E91F79|nr:hypothetical protein [Clostridium sp. FP2]MBZ9626288.1 hypothetical protein [Clostridium sp. FP2]
MKKNILYGGIVFILCGVVLVFAGVFIETLKHGSSIFGWGCSLIVSGIFSIYKYYHWSTPKNRPIYEERLKVEKINLNDERKVMLRQKSGQVMYQIMLYVLLAIDMIFTLVNVDTWILFVLWGLTIFQYIGGLIVYKNLSRKM